MSEARLYCLPVARTGAVFRQTAFSASSTELISYSELSAYLERHHRIELGTVFIFGRSHDAEVFVPEDDPNELSYVLVDNTLVPASFGGRTTTTGKELLPEGREAYGAHLDSIVRACSRTESLVAPTSLSLPPGFIRPKLLRVHLDSFGLPGDSGRAADQCSIEDFVAEPRAVLLGAPGAGKTTLLRYLAISLASRWAAPVAGEAEAEAVLPIYIQLRHFDFQEDLSARNAIGGRETSLASPLPRVAWVLDGLDEVSPRHLERAKSAIRKLVRDNKRDAVYVCSRVASYDGFLRSDCAHFELSPFSWAQTKQWVDEYLRDIPGASPDPLLHSLANVPDLRTLAQNPLLLSILAHQYQFASVVPQQRAQLLERFVAALCEGWDSARGINRRGTEGILPHRRTTLLGRLAFEMKRRAATSVGPSDLDSWFLHYPPLSSQIDAEAILSELAEDTGLIVATERGDRWAFSHSVFCDYLAARHLISRADDTVSLLDGFAESDSWHDVWILACALTEDSRPLLGSVLVSDRLTDETKALLVAGAIVQGLELDNGLTLQVRTLLAQVFARHAKTLGNARLLDTQRGHRLTATHPRSMKGKDAEATASWNFVRSLLMLIYRGRWWRTGQAIVSDLRKHGEFGNLAARLIDAEGTLSVDLAGKKSQPGALEDVILEVDTSLES